SGAAVSRVLFFAVDGEEKRYEATYAGDGKFNIGPLLRGNYRVFGYDNKNAKVALNGGSAVAISGTGTVELDLRSSAHDGQIQGRVGDHNGMPMSNTLVRATSTTLDDDDSFYSYLQEAAQGPQELLTDREGRFRITGLNSQGSYDLYVNPLNG